jgi:hypothetical protein
MMRHDKGENGQVLILVTIFLTTLVLFMAFAADIALMFRHRRNMQLAADAGAVAGALAYKYGPGTADSAAKAAALLNYVTAASNVTVNTSPSDGYHQGTGFVKVVIAQPEPLFFLKAANFSTFTIGAQAVAGTVPSPSCLIALDPTAQGTFNVQGSAVVNTPDCAVHVNSSDPSALCSTGSATIVAPLIGVDGGQTKNGSCNGVQNNVSTGNGQVPDPFAGLHFPSGTDCDASNTVSGTSITAAIAAALPTKTVSGSPVTCFSGSNVSIASGVTLGTLDHTYTTDKGYTSSVGTDHVFVFQNGVSFAGTGTVYGTMDLQGGIYDYGNTQVSMYAPTTGTYNSLAFIMDPSDTTFGCNNSIKSSVITLSTGSSACLQLQFGTGSGALDGIVYAPNSTVYMQDNGGNTTVAGIVAGAINDKASKLYVTENYNLAHPTTTPLSTMAMVE